MFSARDGTIIGTFVSANIVSNAMLLDDSEATPHEQKTIRRESRVASMINSFILSP